MAIIPFPKTTAEHEFASYANDMGFTTEQAATAWKKSGGRKDSAVDHLIDTTLPASAIELDDDDGPPPLISAEDSYPLPPPYGPQTAGGFDDGWNEQPFSSKSTAVALYNPPTAPRGSPTGDANFIDLTKDDNGDSDLDKALKLSANDAGGADDYTKALALSLGDLKEKETSVVDGIAAEDRVRDVTSPTIVRASSPLLSLLTSYLQCLYAVPTFRHEILAFRPTQKQLGSMHNFGGYWRGDENVETPRGDGLPEDHPYWGLIALQRLFALMHETRRSFVHVSEVVKVLDPNGIAFNNPTVHSVRSLHNELIETFRKANLEELRKLSLKGEINGDDQTRMRREALARFSVQGQALTADEVLGDELVAVDEQDTAEVIDLPIRVNSSSSESRQSIYDTIDASLASVAPMSTSIDSAPSLQLVANVPHTLTFQLDRHLPTVDNLDGFGGAGSKRELFKPEEVIWLDRYSSLKSAEIRAGRQKLQDLKKKEEEVSSRRKALSTTESGKDGVELVRRTLDYFKKATNDDPTRAERQQGLAVKYEAVLNEMEKKVADYDARLFEIRKSMTEVFDQPSMQTLGPYHLVAILMRNGLNGREGTWSVVKGDDGRWWRIRDLVKEEVTLEHALEDKSGLMMLAGAALLFYQNTSLALTDPSPVPQFLKTFATEDNLAFSLELPSAITDTWDLPSADDIVIDDDLPLWSPLPDESAPTLARQPSPPSSRTEHIDYIPTSIGRVDSGSPEASAIELSNDDILASVSNDFQDEKAGSTGGVHHIENSVDLTEPVKAAWTVQDDTKMDLIDLDSGDESDDPMRLRGGAGSDEGEEAGDEEEDDGEEFDEDEVELGLLQPMPKEGEKAWDVDFAVGKVGGLPVWLDPTSPLRVEDVECGVCGDTMSMLLQVNSPDDIRPHAAARSLYVYACRKADCLSTGKGKALRVWRTQMPSPNDFFPHTEATLARRKQLEDALDPSSRLSGAPKTSTTKDLWPEWDVACEPEPYEESYLPDAPRSTDEDGENGEDAAEPDTTTGVDRAFLAFQDRIERVPEQVLRFYRLPDVDDPQPLWANDRKIKREDVSDCPVCKGLRQVEFQILSTLLTFLKEHDFSYDTLLVYTCVDNCEIPSREGGRSGWAEEWLAEHKFSEAGVDFGKPE